MKSNKTSRIASVLTCMVRTIFSCALFGLLFMGCQKEHSRYRPTPKYHVGDQLQFAKSIEHDHGPNGGRMWDIPQPFVVVSYYYNETWRDNWYYVQLPDGTMYGSDIDELSLQKWNGRLEK